MSVDITPETLEGPEIASLLQAHADQMLSLSPPGSCHFLPLDGLRRADVDVWSMWENGELLGCGALKTLDAASGEIKSMHTRADLRGRGLGRKMLEFILNEAETRGMTHLYLETGSMDGFLPARRMYEAYGFTECPPFGDYTLNPHSTFMSLSLV